MYQLTFATITPALICGSFADRMKYGPMLHGIDSFLWSRKQKRLSLLWVYYGSDESGDISSHRLKPNILLQYIVLPQSYIHSIIHSYIHGWMQLHVDSNYQQQAHTYLPTGIVMANWYTLSCFIPTSHNRPQIRARYSNKNDDDDNNRDDNHGHDGVM